MEKKTTEQIIEYYEDNLNDFGKTEWVRVEDVKKALEKLIMINPVSQRGIYYNEGINDCIKELSQSKPTVFEVQDYPEQSSEVQDAKNN